MYFFLFSATKIQLFVENPFRCYFRLTFSLQTFPEMKFLFLYLHSIFHTSKMRYEE